MKQIRKHGCPEWLLGVVAWLSQQPDESRCQYLINPWGVNNLEKYNLDVPGDVLGRNIKTSKNWDDDSEESLGMGKSLLTYMLAASSCPGLLWEQGRAYPMCAMKRKSKSRKMGGTDSQYRDDGEDRSKFSIPSGNLMKRIEPQKETLYIKEVPVSDSEERRRTVVGESLAFARFKAMLLQKDLEMLDTIAEEDAEASWAEELLYDELKEDFLTEVVCWDSHGAVSFSAMSCSDEVLELPHSAGEGMYYTLDEAISRYKASCTNVSALHYGLVPSELQREESRTIFELESSQYYPVNRQNSYIFRSPMTFDLAPGETKELDIGVRTTEIAP